jgi:O-antigen ligase
VILTSVSGLTLADAGFMERMKTIESQDGNREESAQDRVMSWEAGMRMFQDNLMVGVGVGNFGAHMGRYLENHEGRDAHNTYVKCAAELGLPGAALLAALVANAFLTLSRIGRRFVELSGTEDTAWYCFGLKLSLIMYLIEAVFGSFNYIEMFSWLIILPAALDRVVDNALANLRVPNSETAQACPYDHRH